MREAVIEQAKQLMVERDALERSLKRASIFSEFETAENWHSGSANHPSRLKMHEATQLAQSIAEKLLIAKTNELIDDINKQLLDLGIEP